MGLSSRDSEDRRPRLSTWKAATRDCSGAPAKIPCNEHMLRSQNLLVALPLDLVNLHLPPILSMSLKMHR